MEFLILLVVMVLMFTFMSRGAKKQREQMMEQRNKAIRVGAHVVTTAGFYGTIVAVDGDAITLESPSGDETVWARQAISGEAELPLAPLSEEEERQAAALENLDGADSEDNLVVGASIEDDGSVREDGADRAHEGVDSFDSGNNDADNPSRDPNTGNAWK